MKYMKDQIAQRVMALLLAVLVLSSGASAIAAGHEEIQPMYVGVVAVGPKITISSSGVIACTDTVSLKRGYTANVTWELYNVTDGESRLSRWVASGSGDITLGKERVAIRGNKYLLRTTAKVYNSSKNLVETVKKDSATVTY